MRMAQAKLQPASMYLNPPVGAVLRVTVSV